MARKPRFHYENAIYHVIVRGNNRECVFANIKEKQKYLSILSDDSTEKTYFASQ